MNTDIIDKQKSLSKDLAVEPELKGLKCLFGLYMFLIITDYIMPQYFGVHIGYDITCTRLANILIIVYMILNPRILSQFISLILKCKLFPTIIIFMFVCTYTMVLRININAFFLPFLEFLTLFMLIYGIRYVVGYKRAIKWSINCAYFFGFYGIIEYLCGQSLFIKFLKTVPSAVDNMYRSGHYRIMGPCGHALGYGLFLIILIALTCLDIDKDEVYLFKRPFLILLLIINVFLTGSRSTLGVVCLEIFLIILASNGDNRKKSLAFIGCLLIVGSIFLLIFRNTTIGQYIMLQITSVVDQLCGTEYAAKYGAEISRLEDSGNYRDVLPLIFKLDWLNPLLGRGLHASFGAVINGIPVISVDNFYVAEYIKYAYPGLIAYILFILSNVILMIRSIVKYKSGLCKLALIATICYFLNLWWLDTLQTLKYEYLLIAIFYAFYLTKKNKVKIINSQEGV